jgi:hypothetical protein
VCGLRGGVGGLLRRRVPARRAADGGSGGGVVGGVHGLLSRKLESELQMCNIEVAKCCQGRPMNAFLFSERCQKKTGKREPGSDDDDNDDTTSSEKIGLT